MARSLRYDLDICVLKAPFIVLGLLTTERLFGPVEKTRY